VNPPSRPPDVIRFRGDIVPLVDLRRLFGLEPFGAHAPRAIIIARAHLADGERTVGLAVDAVIGEIDIRGKDRRDGPDLAGHSHLNVVDGIVTIDDATLLTLLDLPRLISGGLGLTATVTVECPGCDAAPGVDCSSCLSSQSSPP
jgi:purine-binding chemotaxis protein CheW